MCINKSFIIHVHVNIKEVLTCPKKLTEQKKTCPKKSLDEYVQQVYIQQVIQDRMKRKDKKALWKLHKEA